jgi:hypothetical protein
MGVAMTLFPLSGMRVQRVGNLAIPGYWKGK